MRSTVRRPQQVLGLPIFYFLLLYFFAVFLLNKNKTQKFFLNYFLILSICDLSLTRGLALSPQLPRAPQQRCNWLKGTFCGKKKSVVLVHMWQEAFPGRRLVWHGSPKESISPPSTHLFRAGKVIVPANLGRALLGNQHSHSKQLENGIQSCSILETVQVLTVLKSLWSHGYKRINHVIIDPSI